MKGFPFFLHIQLYESFSYSSVLIALLLLLSARLNWLKEGNRAGEEREKSSVSLAQ